jgi:hypothetical protein
MIIKTFQQFVDTIRGLLHADPNDTQAEVDAKSQLQAISNGDEEDNFMEDAQTAASVNALVDAASAASVPATREISPSLADPVSTSDPENPAITPLAKESGRSDKPEKQHHHHSDK